MSTTGGTRRWVYRSTTWGARRPRRWRTRSARRRTRSRRRRPRRHRSRRRRPAVTRGGRRMCSPSTVTAPRVRICTRTIATPRARSHRHARTRTSPDERARRQRLISDSSATHQRPSQTLPRRPPLAVMTDTLLTKFAGVQTVAAAVQNSHTQTGAQATGIHVRTQTTNTPRLETATQTPPPTETLGAGLIPRSLSRH